VCLLTPNVLSPDEVATRDTYAESQNLRDSAFLHFNRKSPAQFVQPAPGWTFGRSLHFWLDNRAHPAKNTANSGRIARPSGEDESGIYESIHFRQTSRMSSPMTQCKHPRVKVVAREEDAEFVECLECGEVFESSEFKDMDIEDTKLKEG